MKQAITPNLWFDTEAEQAADFYISVSENSRIVSVTRYPEGAPRPAGTVMTVECDARDGQARPGSAAQGRGRGPDHLTPGQGYIDATAGLRVEVNQSQNASCSAPICTSAIRE